MSERAEQHQRRERKAARRRARVENRGPAAAQRERKHRRISNSAPQLRGLPADSDEPAVRDLLIAGTHQPRIYRF